MPRTGYGVYVAWYVGDHPEGDAHMKKTKKQTHMAESCALVWQAVVKGRGDCEFAGVVIQGFRFFCLKMKRRSFWFLSSFCCCFLFFCGRLLCVLTGASECYVEVCTSTRRVIVPVFW
ncbi:unnamed protein product, partial [Ectocarpus sp. 12 AP-2014]